MAVGKFFTCTACRLERLGPPAAFLLTGCCNRPIYACDECANGLLERRPLAWLSKYNKLHAVVCPGGKMPRN